MSSMTTTMSRWMAPTLLAASLGVAALAPAPVQAQDLTRVLVDIADVVMRGQTPYYANGNYGYEDRLVTERDRYGRPVYYRTAAGYPQGVRTAPPYGNAYGYHANRNARDVKCNKKGKCKVEYYDPRYDSRHGRRDDDRYGSYRAQRDDRHWDERRRRERD